MAYTPIIIVVPTIFVIVNAIIFGPINVLDGRLTGYIILSLFSGMVFLKLKDILLFKEHCQAFKLALDWIILSFSLLLTYLTLSDINTNIKIGQPIFPPIENTFWGFSWGEAILIFTVTYLIIIGIILTGIYRRYKVKEMKNQESHRAAMKEVEKQRVFNFRLRTCTFPAPENAFGEGKFISIYPDLRGLGGVGIGDTVNEAAIKAEEHKNIFLNNLMITKEPKEVLSKLQALRGKYG